MVRKRIFELEPAEDVNERTCVVVDDPDWCDAKQLSVLALVRTYVGPPEALYATAVSREASEPLVVSLVASVSTGDALEGAPTILDGSEFIALSRDPETGIVAVELITPTTDVVLGQAGTGGGPAQALTCTSLARSVLEQTSVANLFTLLGIQSAATYPATAFDAAGAAAAALITAEAYADAVAAGKQTASANLTALAALSFAANSLIVGSGAGSVSLVNLAANNFLARNSSGNVVAWSISDLALTFLSRATALLMKTDLSLNLVENTALSTWAGSSNLTTVGNLTGGDTGAGFTIDLTTSTVSGKLPVANAPLALGKRVEADITFTDLKTAGTTNNKLLYALPADGLVMWVGYHLVTQFAGTGLTNLPMTIGTASINGKYMSAGQDLKTLAANTGLYSLNNLGSIAAPASVESTTASVNINAYFTGVFTGGHTLNDLTAGEVKVWGLVISP